MHSHKVVKYLYIKNVDEIAYIYAQATAKVHEVLYLARRQKLVHHIKPYPASAVY